MIGIDLEEPTVSDVTADIMTETIGPVTVTAKFTDNVAVASSLYKIGEGGQWLNYENGVTVTKNATIYFKAIDIVGNESEIVSYKVSNIDKAAPVITLTGDNTTPLPFSTLTATVKGNYALFYSDAYYSTINPFDVSWTRYVEPIEVKVNTTYLFRAVIGNAGDPNEVPEDDEWILIEEAQYVFTNIQSILNAPENLAGTSEKVSWNPNGAENYRVHFESSGMPSYYAFFVKTSSAALDLYELPAGDYSWGVEADAKDARCSNGEWIHSSAKSTAPNVVQSNGDGNDDLFFASQSGTWEKSYYAQNVGSVNDWTGTNEIVLPVGRGKIQNLFFGSSDPNILFLTDSGSGDALFLDDVYTDLPEGVEEHRARLYRIREIQAGAGDDIVDMTSQRFEYTGDGQTIRGGAGNDTIWANKGNNFLFGDAGNDRIVGASGNDMIAGGEGSDSMHGGGGNDVFTFCENWGADTVEQLADGFVTLWFESGSLDKWDAGTQTYTDGENSVRVSGVSSDHITLRFGSGIDETAAQYATFSDRGAFDQYTSWGIFAYGGGDEGGEDWTHDPHEDEEPED
jgi:Ca2+-binding RTX toxin-like protein